MKTAVELGLMVYSDPELQALRIIDEEDASALIMIRESNLHNCFFVGDIANKYIVGAASTKMKVSPDGIYSAIGRLCGKADRTVRYYASVASFYNHEVRSRYETLPFSFFAYAIEFGDDYEHVLEIAAGNPQMSLKYLKNLMNSERDMMYKIASEEPEQNDDRDIIGADQDEDGELTVSTKNSYQSPSANAKFATRSVSVLCTLIGDMARRAREMSTQIEDEQLREDLNRATRYIEDVATQISRRYIYGV